MNIVVLGGGKIGFYLVKTLISEHHKVLVIEKNRELCKEISNLLGVPVINGDGTNIDVLKEAEIKSADVFIAVSGQDENNLISCQLVKSNFNVNRTIARVNNPKNIYLFEKLGVDIAISSTSIIADSIEKEVEDTGIKTLMKLRDGNIILSEIEVSESSPVCNKSLLEINIPKECVIVSVIRDEHIIIPNGSTILEAGDYIFAVSSKEDEEELKEFFIG